MEIVLETRRDKILTIITSIILAFGIFTLGLNILDKCSITIPLSFIAISNVLLVIKNLNNGKK